MADEHKAPKTTVEQDPSTDADAASKPDPASNPDPAPAASEPFSLARSVSKLSAWFKRTFPGHENAVIFGAAGLVAAILIFALGIWRTLVIALFVTAGVAIGQVADGDPKILRAIRRFLSDRRH